MIKSKYGLQPNLCDSKVDDRGTFRSPWKAISSLYTEYHELVVFKVGNRNKIRFWEDVWVGDNSLEAMFPSLFILSSHKSRPISEFYNQSIMAAGDIIGWNLHLLRSLLDREIVQLIELLNILERKSVCNSVEDRRDWTADSSGVFSCKSAFAWLTNDNSQPVNLLAKIIWKMSILVKVKVFTRLLVLGKVSVHTALQKRRQYHFLSPGWCVLCKKEKRND